MRSSLLILLSILLLGCSSKYLTTAKETTIYTNHTHPSSSLYYLAQEDIAAHYPKSGFYPLEDNRDAFLARIALIEHAKHTLDLQYFIFAKDETSIAIVQRLLQAADRGVKIRVLIDDLLEKDNDKVIASLAKHPNIEIKLFNPTHFRKVLGWVQLAFNFKTLGRRMHNKLLIADNSAVILGGRNIENIYFEVDKERNFIDNDILAFGPLSAEASNSFETYWHSDISVTIEELAQGQNLYSLPQLQHQIDTLTNKYATSHYIQQVLQRDFATAIERHQLKLIFADAKLYYDIPSKIIASEEETNTHLSEHLIPIINSAKKSIIIINPYFMPNPQMLTWMQKLLDKGVRITVITNSLASNDAIEVYAAYSPYQKKLLEMGVKLYELAPFSFSKTYKQQTYRNGKIPRSSLHSKTMIIDDAITIIGSANLDPRSIKLNTEVVAVIYSKEMAAVQTKIFKEMSSPENAFTLTLEKNTTPEPQVTSLPRDEKEVVWISKQNNTTVKYRNNDANASFLRRLMANISRFFPLEKYI